MISSFRLLGSSSRYHILSFTRSADSIFIRIVDISVLAGRFLHMYYLSNLISDLAHILGFWSRLQAQVSKYYLLKAQIHIEDITLARKYAEYIAHYLAYKTL